MQETKPRKIRGTATIYADDRMEFRPQQAGPNGST